MHNCVVCGKEIHGGYFMRKFRYFPLSTCCWDCHQILDRRITGVCIVYSTEVPARGCMITSSNREASPTTIQAPGSETSVGPVLGLKS
jgi:hypothetical protein